jgi:hypothetical protein
MPNRHDLSMRKKPHSACMFIRLRERYLPFIRAKSIHSFFTQASHSLSMILAPSKHMEED